MVNQLYNKERFSYSTVEKAYVALNSGFQYALLDDIVSKNPCLGVELPAPSERTKEVESLSPFEMEALVAEINKVDGRGCPLYYYGYAYIFILNKVLLDRKWLYRKLTKPDREELCVELGFKDGKGRLMKWPSIKKLMEREYIVSDLRMNKERFVTIEEL